MTKTILQLAIITLSRTAKVLAPTPHAVISILTLGLYYFSTFRMNLYNYDRFTLWQKAVHMMNLVFGLIALVNLYVEEKTPLLILLGVFEFGILAGTFIYQKF
jgi:hypothetical protein